MRIKKSFLYIIFGLIALIMAVVSPQKLVLAEESEILNFNQLIKNYDFSSNFNNWDLGYYGGTTDGTISSDGALIISTQQGRYADISQLVNFQANHKYYINLRTKSNIEGSTIRFMGSETAYSMPIHYDKMDYYYESNGNTRLFLRCLNGDVEAQFYFKYINVIDLTQMFGPGNEPSFQECKEMFVSYYQYTNGQAISLDTLESYKLGYEEGVSYQKAISGESGKNTFITIFEAVGSFLSIELFPGITFGLIIGIPFVISVAWVVIRLFRGGGN